MEVLDPLIYNAYVPNGGNKYIYERQPDGTLKRKSMTVESSSGVAAFPVLLTWDSESGVGTLNKTWQEIKDAFVSGSVPYIYEKYEYDDDGYEAYYYQITMIAGGSSGCAVQGIITNLEDGTAYTNGYLFTAETASGYPSYSGADSE